MANSIVARQQGDDFQARLFWMHAVHLLDEDSSIERVLFETGPKAFDDVVVVHSAQRAPQDHRGKPLLVDHMQCKWHVRPGEFGYLDLTDPVFSGGQTVSILERALQAQRSHAPQGHGARFQLVTNWTASNPLRRMILLQHNALDLDGIYKGGARSQTGRLRLAWAKHLKIGEDELRLLIGTMAFDLGLRSGEALRGHLNDKLVRFGMVQSPASSIGFTYDELIKKLHAQGRKVFDRKSFRELVHDQKLLAGPPAPKHHVIGVRSFMHAIDSIEGRTTVNLNLVPMFDGRYLRPDQSWDAAVYPALRTFLLGEATKSDDIRLVLDAHSSLAYATGAVLDVKSGKTIEIEQRSPGRRFWSETDMKLDPAWPSIAVDVEHRGEGSQLALAIGLTHDVTNDARQYVDAHLPQVGRLLLVRTDAGPSQAAVKCGGHAAALAQALVNELRLQNNRSLVHLFVAAPNGFTFYLGRHHKAVGPAVLYEFDFDRRRDGGYSAALTVD